MGLCSQFLFFLEIPVTGVAAQAPWFGMNIQSVRSEEDSIFLMEGDRNFRVSHLPDPNLRGWARAWEAVVSARSPPLGIQRAQLRNHCHGGCRPHESGSPLRRTPAHCSWTPSGPTSTASSCGLSRDTWTEGRDPQPWAWSTSTPSWAFGP